MRIATLVFASALGAFGLAVAAAPVLAQTPPASRAERPERSERPERREMGERRRAEMEAHRARTIADWTAVLHLSPTQAQQLATVMAPPPRPEGREGWKPGAEAALTTPQRLDRAESRLAEREARMRARIEGMKRFYASLTPDQQSTFDAVTRLSHRGGPRGMGAPAGRWGGPEGRGRMGPPPPAAGE